MISIGTMIKQCEGLIGTGDVSEWEDEFLTSIVERSDAGNSTLLMTDKQIAVVDRIYRKHFA